MIKINSLHYHTTQSFSRFNNWCDSKLSDYPNNLTTDVIAINHPNHINQQQLTRIRQQIARCNWAVYESEHRVWQKQDLIRFADFFNLNHTDSHLFGEEGLSDIKVTDDEAKSRFIPYSNKALKWHTDGYYNPNEQWVTAIILHCNQDALWGGENRIVDPDLLYIHLYQTNRDWVEALMAVDCMSIPSYRDHHGNFRAASRGPIFWFNDQGWLQMRYTQRKRNIQWKDDALLTEARQAIDDWLETSNYVSQFKLSPGQGIISTNVLHNRSAFEDSAAHPRHMLRARYRNSLLTENVINDN